MSIKSHQLQAEMARRRELEHMQIQRTEDVNRYYSHWGNFNTRFEQWTAPEYYKQAEEKLKKTKEKKEKQEQLAQRREKLRNMLDSERIAIEQEQRDYERPKSRAPSTEMLRKINEQNKQRENIKRKLELEAKLYGQWRHGVNDPNLIFDSKSDHQVLAKLNWMDKQIEEQMEREKEESIAQDRNLRLQQEISKTEQTQKERQLIREHEIQEIRALQEKHMEQLKERKHESETLKKEECCLREFLTELDKERELLDASAAVMLAPAENTQAYNLNKVKIVIRQRSEQFRKQIQHSIDMLRRVSAFGAQKGLIDKLQTKYKAQQDAESRTLSQIEAMYESEAKYNLQRCEDVWQTQHLERYNELKELLDKEQNIYFGHLKENRERQAEIIDLRSAHLAAIDNSNEKLKQLFDEHKMTLNTTAAAAAANDSVNLTDSLTVRPATLSAKPSDRTVTSQRRSLAKPTNSFNNLNFDGWQDLPSPTRSRGKGSSVGAAKSSIVFETNGDTTSQQQSFRKPKPKCIRETQSSYSMFSALPAARDSSDTAAQPLQKISTESRDAFAAATKPSDYSLRKHAAGSDSALALTTNSFNNLNFNGWQGAETEARDDLLSQRSALSQHSFESQTSERPKFARKRVAWT